MTKISTTTKTINKMIMENSENCNNNKNKNSTNCEMIRILQNNYIDKKEKTSFNNNIFLLSNKRHSLPTSFKHMKEVEEENINNNSTIKSLSLPKDIVYLSNVNFIEKDNINFIRNELLESVYKLSYYDYIRGRFHFYLCCKSKTNLGTLLLIDSKTTKNYSMINYFKKIKSFCNFENNIIETKEQIYNLANSLN